MKKARIWSVSVCAAAACLGLVPPGAAANATSTASRAAYPAFSGRLYGVVANASDLWAVGLDPSGSLAVNWNGSSWAEYHPTLTNGFLISVAQSSARDVWAVGGTYWFSPVQTLAEHWNGRSWTRVATPNPAGGGYFSAVTALSPRNAWAVGQITPGGPGVVSTDEPLIEHWNGSRWSVQEVQDPAGGGALLGVQATSPSNAWAVGWTGPPSAASGRALIEHWNGRTWTRVAPPIAGLSALRAVTAISIGNVWAVGYTVAADHTFKTLTMHWDGRRWSVVPSATPGGDAQFLGMTASWTNNIWAVGITNPTRCGGGPNCQTLIEHWNSVRWKVIPSPNPPAGYLNALFTAVAVSRTDIWAVGTTDYANTLIVHWNGTSWS